MSRDRFVEFLREGILMLPQHLKGVLRLADDPEIPDEGRAVAAGALLHWLSGTNTIPGARGDILSYVDDVLILRLAYAKIDAIAPEAMARHKADAPELFGQLDEELALMRDYLGDGLGVIERGMARLSHLKHVGRTAAQYAADDDAATTLYEEVQAALVDLDFEEDEVGRALKGIDPLIRNLRS